MRRARILEKECRLVTEKALKCRGTVSVRLEVLLFPEIKTVDQQKLQRNIERLQTVFRDEGCLRLPLPNHIPAEIDDQSLQAALQYSRCSREVLIVGPRDKYPELEFPPGYRLKCLDGRSRALAAAKVLPLADRRWTVDLYSTDLTEELRTVLVEEYSNQDRPHPGEIYRKLRLYHNQRDLRIDNWWFEKRCWARLSPHQRRNVKQLHRYSDITAACDALLDIAGLWGGWKTSTWHKILPMRVDECILCYLDYMKDFWYGCVGKEREAMQKVDETTIKDLENTAPGACRADARDLYGKLKSGKIFGAFNDQHREAIWVEICRLTKERLVPSFSAFFQDLNWLAEPAACVKRLMQLSPRETILSTLEDHLFSGVNQQDGQCLIQKPDYTFLYIPGTKANQVDLGIRQIFLMAMRQYLDMPSEPKRKNLLAKPRPKKADTRVLYEFAAYAYQLGFESNEIYQLIGLEALVPAPQQQQMSWGPEDSDAPVRRCGIPTNYQHEQDKPYLFLEHLYGNGSEEFEEMTSLFVRRSVILAFFGKPTSAYSTEVISQPYQTAEMIRTESVQPGQQSLQQYRVEQYSGGRNFSLQRLQTEKSSTATQSNQQVTVNEVQVVVDTRIPDNVLLGDQLHHSEQTVSAIKGHLDQAPFEQYTTTQSQEYPSTPKMIEAFQQELTTKGVEQEGQENRAALKDIKEAQTEEEQGILGTESAQLSQQSLEQRKVEQYSDTRNFSRQSLQAENYTAIQDNQQIFVNKEQDQQMLDEAEELQHSVDRDISRKRQMQRKKRLQEQRIAVKAKLQRVAREHNTMLKQHRAPKQPEISNQAMQAIPDELESSDIYMSVQDQSQTIDYNGHDEAMEEDLLTATEQSMHQDLAQIRADTEDLDIVFSENQPYNGELTVSAIQGHSDQASSEQYTTTQFQEHLSILKMMEALRQESTEKGVDQMEQETRVSLKGLKEMQTKEGQSLSERALPSHTTIDLEHLQEESIQAEQISTDKQFRDQEDLFEWLEDESVSQEETAHQLAVAQELHDQSLRVDKAVPESKESPPILTTDQEHQTGTAAEDREQSTRVQIEESVEPAEPIIPQAHQTESPRHPQDETHPIALKAKEPQEKQEQSERDEQSLYKDSPNKNKRIRQESRSTRVEIGESIEQAEPIVPQAQRVTSPRHPQDKAVPIVLEGNESQEKQKQSRRRPPPKDSPKDKRIRKESRKQDTDRQSQEPKRRARQTKIKKPDADQKTTKVLKRPINEDREMDNKRLTKIDFSKVDDEPTLKVFSGKSTLTKKEIKRRKGWIEKLDANINTVNNTANIQEASAGQEKSGSERMSFYLQVQNGKSWKKEGPYHVDPSKPEEFMRMLRKWTRKDSTDPWNVFVGSRTLNALTRFDDIVSYGNNTLLITREKNINTDLHPDLPVSKRSRLEFDKNSEPSEKSLLESAVEPRLELKITTQGAKNNTYLDPYSTEGQKLQFGSVIRDKRKEDSEDSEDSEL